MTLTITYQKYVVGFIEIALVFQKRHVCILLTKQKRMLFNWQPQHPVHCLFWWVEYAIEVDCYARYIFSIFGKLLLRRKRI